jgi:UDPglucose 6-dehydrogenase
MKISLIGSGYVGLVTGLAFAEKGHEVICIDKDQEKVEKINSKVAPFYEPEMQNLLDKNLNKNFKASSNIQDIKDTELTFICVGTPNNNGVIDLSYIEGAAKDIGSILKEKNEFHSVVVKSTVPPGTTEKTVLPALISSSGKKLGDFGIAMSPEFLAEGTAVKDTFEPGRVVFGTSNSKTLEKLEQAYADFKVPKISTNIKTAEMIKYASNSLLASLISFSNEIANLSELEPGVDVKEVLEAVHLDKRLTPRNSEEIIRPGALSFLMAGCGFGGSCFPKDVQAIVNFGESKGYDPKILRSVLEINRSRPLKLIDLLKEDLSQLEGKKITILGLSFKPDTDDIRESPAIPLIQKLIQEKAQVVAYDPMASENMKNLFPNIKYANSLEESIKDSDGIVLVTSWKEFLSIPEEDIKDLSSNPLLIDGRRVLDKNKYKCIKFKAIGLKDEKNI